jgi:hypothetical protein
MASQEERELATKLGDVRDSAERRVRHEKRSSWKTNRIPAYRWLRQS